ncbi:bacterio-opsin activator [Sulfolobus acidocaldarius SUSAZ]|nr:bacterio-opsin activator [Sulfolobus acidocaldarius SUSAZ]
MLLYVTLLTPLDEWITNMDWTRNSFTILDIKPEENFSTYRLLIELKGNPPDTYKESFSKVSKDTYMGIIKVRSSGVIRVLGNYSIINGTVSNDSVVWVVVLNGYTELRKLLRDFIDSKIDVKILKVLKAKPSSIITGRQEQILKIALELGYFDFPRRIRLNELSKKLNISTSTLAEIIRRAERNIIEAFLRERDL